MGNDEKKVSESVSGGRCLVSEFQEMVRLKSLLRRENKEAFSKLGKKSCGSEERKAAARETKCGMRE